ncbi:response regulator [Maridesulfovibrio sp.]|uniref:response regulator n=1 Tax=Maridesulfovibrio sp. TaxID=2795000 RepID=UPI002A1888E5|nr:response regulator [Maridesulfovibrio sp.]
MPDLFSSVLIVDDHQSMRRTIADIMRMLGYTNLHFAEDGLNALDKLADTPSIDLILLDWNMPKMTGIEFLQKIRTEHKYKKLPVLMITAEAEQSQVIQAVQAGATNYIVKPFTPATLQRKLKETIRG